MSSSHSNPKQVIKPEITTKGYTTTISAHLTDGSLFPLATRGGGVNPALSSRRKSVGATDVKTVIEFKKPVSDVLCLKLVKKLDGTTKVKVLIVDTVTYSSRNVLESTSDILRAFKDAKIFPPVRVRRSIPLYFVEKLRLRLH